MNNEPVYFSDREQGTTPQTHDEISNTFWLGFVAYVETLLNNHYLAQDFPLMCPDEGVGQRYSNDRKAIGVALKCEIPGADWPLDSDSVPEGHTAIDIIEFFHRRVAQPYKLKHHDSRGHDHIRSFIRKRKTRIVYREQVNLLFQRNGLAFRLDDEGKVRRLNQPVLREMLERAAFNTGDGQLDELLEAARRKFGDPNLNVRREALEKLWDAWERLKTVEAGAGKAQQVTALLTKAIPEPNLRQKADEEAHALTDIGNEFTIRHHETSKHPLHESEYVDYLFHRMFALIWLLLKRTNRLK